jgi:hypothetical protein
MGPASSCVINTKHGLQEGFSLSLQIAAGRKYGSSSKKIGCQIILYKKKECMNNVDSYPIPYKKTWNKISQ